MLETEAPSAKRFAVIGAEASSTKPNNRIIEIAVLIFEGNAGHISLIDSYSTLVNPETDLSQQDLDLRGITEQEIQAAPKFSEIEQKLTHLTRNCTLVTHDKSLALELLLSEFKKIDAPFDPKVQCTFELSKELYPKLSDYSLQTICETLEIDFVLNHRALDQAVACSALLEKFYFDQDDKDSLVSLSIVKLHKALPALDLEFLPRLFPFPGVAHLNSKGKSVFIECFENLKVDLPRFLLRFAKQNQEASIDQIQINTYKDSLMAMRVKEERIDKIKPIFNIEDRKVSWGVFLKENPFSLSASPLFKGSGDLLYISDNQEDALHWITLQVDEIEKKEFAYIDLQDKRLVNRLKKEREKQIRSKVKPFAQYPHDNFVVMGPGRDDDELSCHFFNAGKLCGHAFVSGQAVYDLDSTPSYVKPAKETAILKHYLLREFQDWKNRTRKDHSIKPLISQKAAKSSNQKEANGNVLSQEDRPNFRKKKSKSNNNRNSKNNFKKKTKHNNQKSSNTSNDTNSPNKKKHFSKKKSNNYKKKNRPSPNSNANSNQQADGNK